MFITIDSMVTIDKKVTNVTNVKDNNDNDCKECNDFMSKDYMEWSEKDKARMKYALDREKPK